MKRALLAHVEIFQLQQELDTALEQREEILFALQQLASCLYRGWPGMRPDELESLKHACSLLERHGRSARP